MRPELENLAEHCYKARMRALIFALVVFAAGCKERPVERPDLGISNDAGAAARGRDAGAEQLIAAEPAAEIAGSWHGTLQHEHYGRVRGDVIVEATGHVSYTVTGEGVTHSGVFRVTSWDGATLVVRDTAGSGAEYRLPASLTGDTLTLTIDPVGQVVLKRAQTGL